MSIEMQMFKAELVGYLEKIEAHCKSAGVPMSEITLLLRDPSNEEMVVLLTTETREGVRKAFENALTKSEM